MSLNVENFPIMS